MDNQNLFNVLDFGSSKIRFSTFDNDLNENFSETIPVVLDSEYSNHFQEIKNIIKRSEKKNSFYIKDIILIHNPQYLFEIDISLNNLINEKSSTNKIYNSLLLELHQIMKSNYNSFDISHIIFNKFIINGEVFSEFPFHIKKIDEIKVDSKIICIPKNINIKIKENFQKINLNIKNIFCSTYTKTLFYLKKLNHENTSFLEIGFNKTTIVIYEKNVLKLIYSIPVGSFHITKDISKIFKISIQEAEEIKKLFNNSDTEFSYDDDSKNNSNSTNIILNKGISINTLKKVILYRIQEIFDLSFIKSNISKYNLHLNNSDLFLIGEGSKLFESNTFNLEDKFGFKSVSIFKENDNEICKSGLNYYLNRHQVPKLLSKKQGIFEKFFNYFSK